MNAQQIALKNVRAHNAHNDKEISLNHPNAKCGYGLVLRALSVLAPEYRKTQMQVAKFIGRPVRRSDRWSTSGNLRPVSYFSTHGTWATLSNAKLIEKKNGSWTLTELGERYVHEMNIA